MKTREEVRSRRQTLQAHLKDSEANIKDIERRLKQNAKETVYEDTLKGQIQTLEKETQAKIISLVKMLNNKTGKKYTAALTPAETETEIQFIEKYEKFPYLPLKRNMKGKPWSSVDHAELAGKFRRFIKCAAAQLDRSPVAIFCRVQTLKNL